MSRPRGRAFLMVLLALTTAGPAARAEILVNGSAGHGWLPFSAPSEAGNPYWDQHSLDGAQYNVGYYLTKTGGYAAPAALGKDSPALGEADLQYWGSNGSPHRGDPVQTLDAGGRALQASLFLTFAGRFAQNEFGWYDVADPATLHPLYDAGLYNGTGPDYPVSAVFQPAGEFGLYLISNGQVFYSQSSLNPDDDLIDGQEPHQHFAVFRQTDGKLWIGVEDKKALNATEQYGDFNDIIVSIHETPEPAGIVLAGLAIASCCLTRLRRWRLLQPHHRR